jgi:hypothetical protein
MGEAGVRLEASPPPSLRPHSFLAACSGGGEAGGQCWRGLCGGRRPSARVAPRGTTRAVGAAKLDQSHCSSIVVRLGKIQREQQDMDLSVADLTLEGCSQSTSTSSAPAACRTQTVGTGCVDREGVGTREWTDVIVNCSAYELDLFFSNKGQ